MSGRRLATRNALEPALHHRSAGRAQGVQGHHRGHDARRAAARPPGARLHAGVARLARRTGAAVVPVHSYWDASLGKYRLRYEPALELVRSADEEADVGANTKLFNKTLESFIRRYPDQWFWVHRRWKNRPPAEEAIYSDEKKAQ